MKLNTTELYKASLKASGSMGEPYELDLGGVPPFFGSMFGLFETPKPHPYVPTGVAKLDEAVQKLPINWRYGKQTIPGHEFVHDFIDMLPPEQFNSPEDYAHGIVHEVMHWTGGTTSPSGKPLNRLMRGKMHDYGKEELIAELATAMLFEEWGLFTEHTKKYVADYLHAYLRKANQRVSNPTLWTSDTASEAEQLAEWEEVIPLAEQAVDYFLKETGNEP